MSIGRGFIILGVCIVLFLAELLLYWARTQTAIPPTPTQKLMMFVTVGTVIVGAFALLGGIVEHFAKRRGIGNYVLYTAVGAYALFFFVF